MILCCISSVATAQAQLHHGLPTTRVAIQNSYRSRHGHENGMGIEGAGVATPVCGSSTVKGSFQIYLQSLPYNAVMDL
jgi:hypothetical protein